MTIRCHPHALARMEERGTSEEEVIETAENGEQFAAKFGRTGFRRNFALVKSGVASSSTPSRWKPTLFKKARIG